MSLNLFQMTDAQLCRAIDAYNDRLLDKYLDQSEPHCRDCTHYCKSIKQCEREVDDDYVYVDVDPEDYACDDFEADEYEPEVDY